MRLLDARLSNSNSLEERTPAHVVHLDIGTFPELSSASSHEISKGEHIASSNGYKDKQW